MNNTPIVFPAVKVYPLDLMDRALDRLRVVHLALSPDNKGWFSDAVLFAAWAQLEQVIKDLEPIREALNGDVEARDEAVAS